MAELVSVVSVKRSLSSLFSVEQNLEGGIYKKHISYLNEVLQKEMGMYNFPFKLRIVPHQELNDHIRHLESKGVFKNNAQVWENQVETFVEVMHKCYSNPSQSGVIIGATQLGKTMTILLLSILEIILAHKTGFKYKAIFIIPGRKNLETQTQRDYKAFSQLYDFEVEADGERCLYSTAKKSIHMDLAHGTEAHDIPIYRRTSGKIKNEVKKYMDIAHKQGFRLIVFVDECHWGAARQSVMKDILYEARNLTDIGEGDVMIAISATPFQVSDLGRLWKVFCRTYPGYIGYAFHGGELLDKRYPLIVPRHVPFTDKSILERFGIADFQFVCRKFYKNGKAYAKAQRSKKSRSQEKTAFAAKFDRMKHYDYKLWCENAIIALINSCLTRHNVLDGRGFICRFFNSNMEVTDFFLRKKHLFDKSLNLVAWQDDSSSMDLDDLLMSKNIGHKDYKVIFVTGNGRMGNRIKDESGIYYAADFADNSSLTAAIQGLVGRLTGKKSVVPIIFLSEKTCDMLDMYIRSKGKYFSKAPHDQTTVVGQWQHGEGVTIWCNEEEADGRITFADLEMPHLAEFLDKYTKHHCGNRDRLPQGMMAQDEQDTFWEMFNEDTMYGLEKALGLEEKSIICFTNDQTVMEVPYVDHNGFAYEGTIGFRTFPAGGKFTDHCNGNLWRGSNLASDRILTGTRKGPRRLQPQLHVRIIKKGRSITWRPVAVKFRFVNSEVVGRQSVLPTQNTVFNPLFATINEKMRAARETNSVNFPATDTENKAVSA